jgi:uncharacterized protein YdaL
MNGVLGPDGRPGHRTRRTPAGLRLFVVLAAVAGLIVSTDAALHAAMGPPKESLAASPTPDAAPLHALAAEPGAPGPDGDPSRRTLVLYRETGASAEYSHSDAIQAANLASRGGAWVIQPVERYVPGQIHQFQSVIFAARYAPAPLPPAFLHDVATGGVPVLWMGEEIEQLFAAEPSVTAGYGWRPGDYDPIDVPEIEYAGQLLHRQTGTSELLKRVEVTNEESAITLGVARHSDGSGYPWAVRSGNVTYIGEVPFSYVDTSDRYLAAADLISRLVAPTAPDRKRALIRIEDVGPNTDPEQIKAIADTLSRMDVPFSLAVYPYYRDPHGDAHDGEPASFRLVDAPALVEALRYAVDRGATLVSHGYTHQYEDLRNPYSGVSASDYEFYLAYVDEQNDVQLSGPVPSDSKGWAAERMARARAEFVRVELPAPAIFEFPHYTASAVDYQAAHEQFGVRYDQGTYFASLCPAGACSTAADPSSTGLFQQYFPYPVRDVYGSVVIPENIGNISEAFNNNEARTPQDLIDNARAMTVVRDGVASGFFHPFLPIGQLEEVVTGIQQLGFEFVAPADILAVHGS